MIRRATLDDIPEVIFWGEKFHQISPFIGLVEFSPQDLEKSLTEIIGNTGAVFLNGHGICGGLIVPLYFNHSAKVAVELFWYAERDGRALRRAFHKLTTEHGATGQQMTCLADDNEARMRKHYERLGYKPMEVSFYKAV